METPIGGADCSQCEWEGNECKRFEPSLNTKVMCPVYKFSYKRCKCKSYTR